MADRFTLPATPRLTGPDLDEARVRQIIEAWMSDTREVLQEAVTSLAAEGQQRFKPAQLPVATVAQLQGADPRWRAGGKGRVVYCENDVGGATLAYSDGTNWRRATDRAIVSET
jgi:hypothetical protein